MFLKDSMCEPMCVCVVYIAGQRGTESLLGSVKLKHPARREGESNGCLTKVN